MRAYVVLQTVYYETSDILKAFFDKQKAIDYAKECADNDNSKMSPDDKYRFKLMRDGISWGTSLQCYEIEEVEIE